VTFEIIASFTPEINASAGAVTEIASYSKFIVIFLGSALTNNIALNYFLGMCPFLAVSKQLEVAGGMGIAVTVVMTVTAIANWLMNHFILEPFGLEIFQFLVFIIVISATVQVLGLLINRFSPFLREAFGIFLPLIAVNCAILGVSLFMLYRQYSFIEMVFFSLGSGIGWTIAILALGGLRKHLIFSDPPSELGEIGITLLLAGFMAMAFAGFNGIAYL